jgi:hypothetical protein
MQLKNGRRVILCNFNLLDNKIHKLYTNIFINNNSKRNFI